MKRGKPGKIARRCGLTMMTVSYIKLGLASWLHILKTYYDPRKSKSDTFCILRKASSFTRKLLICPSFLLPGQFCLRSPRLWYCILLSVWSRVNVALRAAAHSSVETLPFLLSWSINPPSRPASMDWTGLQLQGLDTDWSLKINLWLKAQRELPWIPAKTWLRLSHLIKSKSPTKS